MSEKKVVYIDHLRVERAWDVAYPLLEASFEYQGNWAPSDILNMLKKNEALLWLTMDKKSVYAAAVTWIDEYPTAGRVFTIAFAAAGEMKDLRAMYDYFVAYADNADCYAIDLHGRRGWVRELKDLGFEEYSTTTRNYL